MIRRSQISSKPRLPQITGPATHPGSGLRRQLLDNVTDDADDWSHLGDVLLGLQRRGNTLLHPNPIAPADIVMKLEHEFL